MTYLDKIITNTRMLQSNFPAYEAEVCCAQKTEKGAEFYNALKKEGVSFICECKKASPSKGLICAEYDAVKIAEEYSSAGAAAISVLTEETFFKGCLDDLKAVSNAVETPVLRKDFVINKRQIFEAYTHGAAAVLLIVAALKEDELKEFINFAEGLGLATLVEVHTENEIETALSAGAKIVGINNRDLHSFKISLDTSLELVKKLPENVIKVSESGIMSRDDVEALERAGFDAVLIGESFMTAKDKAQHFKLLRGG